MRVELDPAVPDLDEATLRHALAASGVSLAARPIGAWTRAAAHEAVENEPTPPRSGALAAEHAGSDPRVVEP
jgi:hypothetical protein